MQRAIVDFGADVSFQEAQKKLHEHYRLVVPVSAIQTIVENHAKHIFDYIEVEDVEHGRATLVIAEMDGSMVPIVDTAMPNDKKSTDSRRCKSVRWQEARLCFAKQPDQLKPIFYATMEEVDRAGDLLYRAAKQAGFGPKTKVHGLGDGARWIENQMRRKFHGQVNYLVDFYHVSEYLAKASEHSWASEKEKWRQEKQKLLKENKYKDVLDAIRLRLPLDWDPKKKKEEHEEEGTPVEKCYKYISNRENCLDYKSALEQKLPIGSGEVESGHRYIIQKRLKIAGAWWRSTTANDRLALRILRANDDWDSYWQWQQLAA